uniref:LSDAT_euk domain-containing protein n=1 Tax=Globodera pallida TaxID=36090 RepID=A0A183BZJ6_GLOPA
MTAIFISLAFCFVLGAVFGDFKCHDPLEDEEFDVPGNNVLMNLYKNSNELSNGNGDNELKQFVCDLSERVSVGIAPWGLLKRREDFVGRDKVVLYHPQNFHPKTRLAVLNNRHSYFLLVDNGTVGRYGADIILRRRLESYIAEKQKLGGGIRSVPVVCVVLEGGTCTIRTVLDYVTTIPKVPVVICDGSGRASDLLAFAHRYIQEDGNLPEGVRPQLLSLIEDVFFYDKHDAHSLIMDILACVRQRNLLTVFRLGEDQKQDVDYAILTALLKGHNLSPAEQLSLALAWNRVDIARSDIFVMGQDWPKTALNNAMMEALIHNRVDFVRLLLENGVSMHDFLTIGRLEELYNTDQGPPNTLYYIVRDVVKIRAGYRYKLPHIGMAIEKLMANGFRSHYTSSQFSRQYSEYRNKLKESQRYSQSPIDLQTVSSRGGAYHRTGSDFFTRGFFRNFPSSASDTRLGENHTTATGIRTTGGQPQASQAQQRLHNSSSTSNYATMNAISGNRALSNHILWRTAYRREGINNLGARQKSTATMIMPPANRELPNDAIEYATEVDEKQGTTEGQNSTTHEFIYPFSDLLLWAVLTKRHEMALCMWQHGEEALAKALVACRLYKTLANEAAEDYLEVEVCEELKTYAEEFRQLSLELVDHCYKQDDAQTLQLLTYELFYWGHQTCLSLAVIVNNKQFLAHPCCQILLADLWHGGLRIRSNSNLKVIMGILFPPSIFLLEFKSREELLLQPQTAAEHQKDINESSSSSSESSSSSSSSESESDDDESDAGERGGATIFQSKRKRHRPSHVSSSTAIKEDIEMGKQKNREPSRNTPMKDGRVAKNPQKRGLEDGAVSSRGKCGVGEGVNALVAHSTLGAAVPSATSSTGGSPLLSHAPLPLNNSLNAWTAPADCHMRTDRAIRSDGTAPHFLLGSISENIDGIPHTKNHYLHGFGGVESNVISLLGFGLARQSITYPNEEWDWLLLRNVFYKPYFMLYGEVYADEIDTCGDEAWDEHLDKNVSIANAWTHRDDRARELACVPGHWIPPILMTIFLLIANILLISMLIAIFNNIFESANKISQQIWLFQRYRQVMEYEATPFLPPPFTPIYYIYMTELILLRVNDITSKETTLKGNVRELESRLVLVENRQTEPVLDCLWTNLEVQKGGCGHRQSQELIILLMPE